MVSIERWQHWAVCSIVLVHTVLRVSADCGTPPIHSDKTHTNYDATYDTGDSATYSCAPGYDVQSGGTNKTSICQADGSWSSITFTCTRGSCPSISAPSHGEQSSYDYRVGQQVEFTCNAGYSLQGTATTTCLTDRTWSQTAPSCIVVTCPSLAVPANGQVSPADTTYGTIVTYTCTNGYIYSESSTSRECQGNSTWSGVDGQCNEIDCGAPSIDLGSYTLNGGTTYAYQAMFSCNANTLRVPSTDDTSQCNAQQQWDPPPPKCYQECSAPVVLNAQAIASSSPHNTVVTIRCLSGYELADGLSSLTCFNGTWIPESLACVPAPTEASVTTSVTTGSSTRELPTPQTPTIEPSEASEVVTSSSTQSDMRNTSTDGIILDGTDNPTWNGTSNLENQKKLLFVALGVSLFVIFVAVPVGYGVNRYNRSNKVVCFPGAPDDEALQARYSKTDANHQSSNEKHIPRTQAYPV